MVFAEFVSGMGVLMRGSETQQRRCMYPFPQSPPLAFIIRFFSRSSPPSSFPLSLLLASWVSLAIRCPHWRGMCLFFFFSSLPLSLSLPNCTFLVLFRLLDRDEDGFVTRKDWDEFLCSMCSVVHRLGFDTSGIESLVDILFRVDNNYLANHLNEKKKISKYYALKVSEQKIPTLTLNFLPNSMEKLW